MSGTNNGGTTLSLMCNFLFDIFCLVNRRDRSAEANGSSIKLGALSEQ